MTRTVPSGHAAADFRTDINGLRAYSVMAVLFYHFGLAGFAGGFAGVDVFFVLSGYLMTAIIWQRLEQGRFTLSGFYLDRTRRIVPALLVVCLALMVFGWFWLPPFDYARLGTHAASSASFTSNFIYKGEEGYFDAPSRDKWLLHTWSLSVEWQFYMLYPLLLLALRRLGGKASVIGLGVLAAVSFAACVVLTPGKSSFCFYVLPARAWEMAVGGLVYFASRKARGLRFAGLIEALGMLLIIGSFAVFSAETLWPGAAAGVPVLGAVLVLMAARERSFFTGAVPLQRLGDWSYSVYLWHWPLVVGLDYFLLPHTLTVQLIFIAASILLGYASYHLVEQPLRRADLWRDRKKAWSLALGSLASVVLLGVILQNAAGFPARVPEQVARIDAAAKTPADQIAAQGGCGFNKRKGVLAPCVDAGKKGTIFLWGDSHAGMIKGVLHQTSGATVISAIHSCATVFDAELKSKTGANKCAAFNDAALNAVKALPKGAPVVVANRFSMHVKGPNEGVVGRNYGLVYADAAENARDPESAFIDHLSSSLCRIRATGHPVYVLAPVPEMGVLVPQTLARRFMVTGATPDIFITRAAYAARHDVTLRALNQAKKTCGVRILDPVPAFCDKEKCQGVDADGLPLYFDDDHLNDAGVARLARLLLAIRPS